MIKTNVKTFGEHKYGNRSLLIVTGLHGNEIAPIILGNRLIKLLEQTKTTYSFPSITIMNGVNITGVVSNKREYTDLTGGDLNRSFDIYPPQSNIVNSLSSYKDTHFLIDIHSSPNCANVFLYNARSAMPDHFWKCVSSGIPYAVWENDKGTIKSHFWPHGVTYEVSGMGREPNENALKTLIAFISMLGRDDLPVYSRPMQESDTLKDIKALYSGLIKWNIAVGDKVKAGDCIAQIENFNGDILYKAISSYYGRAIDLPERNFINAGEVLYSIQPDVEQSI